MASGSALRLNAADATWAVRATGVTNDDDPVRLTIWNDTADSYEFRHGGAGGVLPDANTTGTPVLNIVGIPAGFTLAVIGGDTPYSPVLNATTTAGSTCILVFTVAANAPGAASHPVDSNMTWSGTFYWRKLGDTTWNPQAWELNGTWKFNYSGSGNGLTPNPFSMGTFHFEEPAPPSGKITTTGGTTLSTVGKRVEIMVGGEVVASQVVAADVDLAGNPVLTTLPNLVWETDSPDDYIGLQLKVLVNGNTVFNELIEGDGEGSFDIVKNISVYEGADLVGIPDGPDEGLELPVNNTLPDGMDTDTPDDGHDRPAPPAVNDLGSDPISDNATSTSVKDNYRATRAAIEDALHTNHNGNAFEFSGWAEVEHGGGENGDGENAASALGGGIAALGSGVGTHTFSVPVGAADALGIRHLLAGTTVAMTPPDWSPVVRMVCLIIMTVLFVLALVSIVRSAFAGK